MDLDKKDTSIISILKEDARLSIRDIAKETGIRPSTVHQRIQKLRKERVIERFTLKLNNNAIGEGFIAFLLVKTKPSVLLEQRLLHNYHVKEVFGVTGEHDIILKLKFNDIQEFNDYILRFRREQQVENTLTMIVTAVLKEEI